jgi:hypothetical protein
MGKRTFKSRTFRAFTFKSRTWGGSLLGSLFCHPFTTHEAFAAFVASMNAYVADQSSLSASDIEFLDLDGDGDISFLDRDRWVQLLTRTNLSAYERYPFGDQTPTESDPLGLASERSAPDHVIIIDPQNPDSVKITRGTNEVRTQDGDLLDDIFTNDLDNTYNHIVWYDLDSLDETHWDSATALGGTVRRFPNNSNQTVTIYVRGGTMTLSKEIQVRRNNGDWERPRIIIMGYPGDPQRPKIHCGSSLIESGIPANKPPHPNSVDGYRFMYFFRIDRAALWMSGLEFIGYRGDPPNRIFADKLVFLGSENYGPIPNVVLYDCVFRDCRGIPHDHPDADDYPEWIDSQYDNRWNHVDGNQVQVWNSQGSNDDTAISTVRIATNDKVIPRIERCHVRTRDVSGPPFTDPDEPQGETGDGIGCSSGVIGLIVTRCLVDGRTPHAAIANASQGTIDAPAVVNYCDVSNPDHTCISIGNGVFECKYNRIHDFTTRVGEVDAPGHGIQMGPWAHQLNGAIVGNVIFNPPEDPSYFPTTGIWVTQNNTYGVDIGALLIEQNVLYRTGTRIGYAGNDHATVDLVKNITHRDNAIVDLPPGNNAQNGSYDAPILTNIYQFPTQTRGNVWVNNLITRFDGDPTVLVQENSGVGHVDYTLAQLNDGSTFTGSCGNYNDDPMFTNPDAGDFTLQPDSPLEGVFDENVPLVATPPWDEYEALGQLCGT